MIAEIYRCLLRILGGIALLLVMDSAFGFSANRVWLELRPNGRYRVSVDYTVPELKERRQAFVEFSKREEAEALYYDVLRGADFYLPDAGAVRFEPVHPQPRPW